MKFKAVHIFLLIFTSAIYSQIDTTHTEDAYLNSLIDNEEYGEENDLILYKIEELMKNPIHLNTCTIDDILKIPFVDRAIAQEIINYRNANGIFFSEKEILGIDGIPHEIVLAILPYVILDSDKIETKPVRINGIVKLNPLVIKLRSRVFTEPNVRNGFVENKFAGSRYKFYNRAEINFGKFDLGLLTEKDAGENFITDFYSFYFQSDDLWILDNIILGDYLVEFGHGLALWSPYSIAKTSSVLNIPDKNSNFILPYRSTDENKFMRGTAFTIGENNFSVSGFFSLNKIDGYFDSLDTSIKLTIDGFHRTVNELSKKDQIDIMTFGAIANYIFNDNFALGFLSLNYKFGTNKSIYFHENEIKSVYSLNYETNFESIHFSGETALIANRIKTINNLLLKINSNLSTIFSLRSYACGTETYYGNGFGESYLRENEIGFYTGVRIHNQFGFFNFYFDKFKLTNHDEYPFPFSGNEFLFHYQRQFSKNVSFSARYFLENKEITEILDQFGQSSNRRTNRFRIEAEFKPMKYISDKIRVEYSNVQHEKSKRKFNGMLIFNDIKFRLFDNKLFAAIRLTFFRTDAYESRIYSFENDLPGILSNPSFFENGYKWYFLIKYSVISNLSFSFKFSELYKPDEESIGSGFNEIRGNSEKRFNLQLDYTL